MTLNHFMDEAISPWMRDSGPDSDIVLSSRVRLARNFSDTPFPLMAEKEELDGVKLFIQNEFAGEVFSKNTSFEFIPMENLNTVERSVFIEKHLISPLLAKNSPNSAAMISENERISVMINEEDHVRIQLYLPGLQLMEALQKASEFDDWLENKINYAFDEKKGYLTSCPTNVGTGMRASVMLHLPALTVTKQLDRMTPAINQLGLVVRGIYGEGSETIGNLFQVSNQITLGRTEEAIIADLQNIVSQLIQHERKARQYLQENLGTKLEDRIFRSLGVLEYSRIIESKEAASCLSYVRLGIDLGTIQHISRHILNELMVLIQPGFLQHYSEKTLNTNERDELRATLIRDRLQIEEK